MWWLAGVAVLSALGVLERRSWKTPSGPAKDDHISSYYHARTLTGGTAEPAASPRPRPQSSWDTRYAPSSTTTRTPAPLPSAPTVTPVRPSTAPYGW